MSSNSYNNKDNKRNNEKQPSINNHHYNNTALAIQDLTENNDFTSHESYEGECTIIYTPEEKKLVRKINFVTVPFICIIAFLQVSHQKSNYSIFIKPG